MRVSVDILL